MATATAVRVTITGTIANPDLANIGLTRGEEVEWYSDTECLVKFPAGSPFKETEFHVPAHGSVWSGPVVKGTNPCKITGCTAPAGTHPGHYKYMITDVAGKVLVDPQVIVKP